jgi:hypothetical protein
MKLHSYFFMLGLLFSAPINAQVYKCTSADVATGQSKVIYTDAPCTKSSKQTLTSIQAKSNFSTQALQTTQLASANQLDSAVTSAVLKRDFKLAKSLANTKEQWRLIAIAEGEAPPAPLTVANVQPVVSRAEECAQAKDNFEYVSRNSWRDKDLVAAKKSVMYVACGMPEPASNPPIFVGQRFGGFQSGRLFYPNAIAPYYAPHHTRPNHHYPHANHHNYGQNNLNSGFNQSGFSLSYRSRHFGISTGGYSTSGVGASNISTGGFSAR